MYGPQLPTTGISWLIYAVIGLALVVAGALTGVGRRVLGLFR